MLSEEEKKAIEELKKQYRLSTNVDCITTDIRNEYAETILNLIEKQQAEIEYYKSINATEKKRHKQTEKSLKGQIAHKDKEIKLLKEFHNKHIKIINEMAGNVFLMNGDRGCTKQEIIEYFTNKV